MSDTTLKILYLLFHVVFYSIGGLGFAFLWKGITGEFPSELMLGVYAGMGFNQAFNDWRYDVALD